jgi:nicotinate-nucleotide adenylyltransferase
VSYTFETVRRLRRRHPGASLWLLAGSDALAGLARWRRPAELARDCGWVVGVRPGDSRLAVAVWNRFLGKSRGDFPKRLLRLRGTFPDISSTSLRAGFLAALDPWEHIPRPVAAYIGSRGLYGLAARRELERTLSPERWRHTLAVARWALELADRHGLDPEAAALAGLLHDAGRRYDPAALARMAPRLRRAPWRVLTARRAPLLLHAYAGAELAARRFGVSDPAVLAAISDHTLGRRGMGPLERLLYVADASSEDRAYPGVARLRALAREDLDAAFARAAASKVRWARARGSWVHPRAGAFASWVASRFA